MNDDAFRSDTALEPELLDAVDHVLGTARSVRRKLDLARDVPLSVLHECVDVATQAPTGLGGENWRFVFVRDVAQKTRLADVYRELLDSLARDRGLEIKATQRALIDNLARMPVLAFVCVDGEPPSAEPTTEGDGDTRPGWESQAGAQVAFFGSILPAAWSFMLALRARGLGATWTTVLSGQQARVKHILEMPDATTVTVMLPVAYTHGARLRRAKRLDARAVCFVDRWGGADVE